MNALASQSRHVMTWPGETKHLDRLDEVGDRVTQVGLFFFTVQADGTIADAPETAMQTAAYVKQKWPHMKMLLTAKNDGDEAVFRSLVANASYQDTFLSELHRILDRYPWCDGVDIDLERGPNDLKEDIYPLYQRIYDQVKSRTTNRHVHLDLPPMTGPGFTIGPEKWCEYEKLKERCDTVQIMTYGYAWAGSSPGPTTPISWLKDVLTYAVSVFRQEQVFTGAACYGYRWQIHDYPPQLDEVYRGTGGGFAPFLRWMLGDLSHTDSYRTGTETQAYIPFASFYDPQDFVHDLYLHVYDYPGAGDEDAHDMNSDAYAGTPFLTAYEKTQKTDFSGIVVDQKGTDYVEKTGAVEEDKELGLIYPLPPSGDSDGYVRWTFDVPSAGIYDVVFRVRFPWWDQQLLHVTLDGNGYDIGGVPQWYPYYRRPHWYGIGRLSLDKGSHTLELFGANSESGTFFYGFRVAASFVERFYGGHADFTIRPRTFVDREGVQAWPYENRFKVTPEVLRRPPDYVPIWHDDFKDWSSGDLPSNRYTMVSGSWTVQK